MSKVVEKPHDIVDTLLTCGGVVFDILFTLETLVKRLSNAVVDPPSPHPGSMSRRIMWAMWRRLSLLSIAAKNIEPTKIPEYKNKETGCAATASVLQ